MFSPQAAPMSFWFSALIPVLSKPACFVNNQTAIVVSRPWKTYLWVKHDVVDTTHFQLTIYDTVAQLWKHISKHTGTLLFNRVSLWRNFQTEESLISLGRFGYLLHLQIMVINFPNFWPPAALNQMLWNIKPCTCSCLFSHQRNGTNSTGLLLFSDHFIARNRTKVDRLYSKYDSNFLLSFSFSCSELNWKTFS